MFNKFRYESVPLDKIRLDMDNPRIITPQQLTSEKQVASFLFQYENLADFVKKIASEGKNLAAEKPYLIPEKEGFYTVVEGNRRITSYKLLTGRLAPPEEYEQSVPSIPDAMKTTLEAVDCAIAPNRDALLPIMAEAHFGLGAKSRWSWLGSRKAVCDQLSAGKSVSHLARVFEQTPAKIKDFIIEYRLYEAALALNWTNAEKEVLLDPRLEFNPPVRFLQSSGHKLKVGVEYDKANLKVTFASDEAKRKFRHLILKLVVNPGTGLKATSSYDDVFRDYVSPNAAQNKNTANTSTKGTAAHQSKPSSPVGEGSSNSAGGDTTSKKPLKAGALFDYPLKIKNLAMVQMMSEAKSLDTRKFPAAGTFLLRAIIETLLEHIILEENANPEGKQLNLETALSIAMGNTVSRLDKGDKKILKELKNNYLDYLNLGSHGSITPNFERLIGARDCISQFVRKHV